MRVAAIVLAAGSSSRFGSPKQVATVGGERLLERAINTCSAAGFEYTVVVLGGNASLVQGSCDLARVEIVSNNDWASGMASTVRAGISAIKDRDVDAAVMLACDMPFVTPEHLRALVALSEVRNCNVSSEGQGWMGVPACFLRSSFPDLLALSGDMGARRLLVDSPRVRLTNDMDVDTPDDLLAANRIAKSIG